MPFLDSGSSSSNVFVGRKAVRAWRWCQCRAAWGKRSKALPGIATKLRECAPGTVEDPTRSTGSTSGSLGCEALANAQLNSVSGSALASGEFVAVPLGEKNQYRPGNIPRPGHGSVLGHFSTKRPLARPTRDIMPTDVLRHSCRGLPPPLPGGGNNPRPAFFKCDVRAVVQCGHVIKVER